MTDIIWRDPPPDRRGGASSGRMSVFVDALKTRPGQWALYAEARSSNTAGYGRKRYPGTEWRTVTIAYNKHDIYARWVGA